MKNLHDAAIAAILERTGAQDGDIMFFGADKAKVVNDAIGALRLKVGHSDFAKQTGLFEDRLGTAVGGGLPDVRARRGRQPLGGRAPPLYLARRTATKNLMDTDPGNCIAKAYDMVLNGWELGGGSVAYPPRRRAGQGVCRAENQPGRPAYQIRLPAR